MTDPKLSITVREVPEIVNASRGRHFLSELESGMASDHPFIVLDCSKVRQMDRPTVQLILSCLEEVMKRNGDVKLAGVPARAMARLETTGVSRLFESFETNAGAVNSFRRAKVDAASLG